MEKEGSLSFSESQHPFLALAASLSQVCSAHDTAVFRFRIIRLYLCYPELLLWLFVILIQHPGLGLLHILSSITVSIRKEGLENAEV